MRKKDGDLIADQTGDRKYFSTIPNIVVDEATPLQLALYVHLKRIAGEKGTCYVSRRNQTVRFRMDHRTIKRELGSLIAKGWVLDLGMKTMNSHGQKVREVAIADVWKKNVDSYATERKGSTKMDRLSDTKTYHSKDKGDTDLDRLRAKGVGNMPRLGGTYSPRKKNHTKKNQIDTPAAEAAAEGKDPDGTHFVEKTWSELHQQDIVDIVDAFKPVNPAFGKWYGNRTQRQAIERMIQVHTLERLLKVIALLPQTNVRSYMPTITTPLQLEDKWASLAAGLVKEKEKLQAKGKQIIL